MAAKVRHVFSAAIQASDGRGLTDVDTPSECTRGEDCDCLPVRQKAVGGKYLRWKKGSLPGVQQNLQDPGAAGVITNVPS